MMVISLKQAPGGILDLRAIVLFGVADLMDLNFIPFIRTKVNLYGSIWWYLRNRHKHLVSRTNIV